MEKRNNAIKKKTLKHQKMSNMFLHGCSDHQDQLFCLFELEKLPWPYG